jgi:Family of unknown function (DUF5302)
MANEQSGAKSGVQSGAEASPAPETAAPETAAPQAAEGAASPAPPKPDLNDTKRKFREAPERKRGNHASAEGVDHTGKVHGSHGPAASRRSFRRKSGG